MPKHQVTLTLEGLPADDGHVKLGDFLRELQLLNNALTKTERAVSAHDGPAITYRVVDLSHSSPARIILGAYARRDAPDVRHAVLGALIAIMVQLGNNDAPDIGGHELLEDLLSMARPVGKTLSRVSLDIDGQEFSFSSTLRSTVKELLAPQQVAHGFIRGQLEAINLHGAANVFKIYPRTGPGKVTCHFPGNLVNAAVSAVNQYVEVYGLLKYRANDPYPFEVEVERIQADGESDGAPPAIGDLYSIAPELTGGMPAEDWLAIRRMEQEEELLALLG